ncbi:hypothetical protein ONZ43_g155 [Nemania bipapillata]|uniref:Uncharacterized protein n=1 Tax=Nemania bipapillata TaxID=110536 RepID=A0ACC2J9C6_9PEZI|nr:hypothetical protein ONZ43_g155 [Nemania bipapillata]
MAPKRSLGLDKPTTGSAKRQRLRGQEEVYSPNVDTSELSELTDDEEEHRNVLLARLDGTVDDEDHKDIDGNPSVSALSDTQLARELRASRRLAEKQDEDFTEEDDPLMVNIDTEEPSDEAAFDSNADAEGEEVEEAPVAPEQVSNIGVQNKNPFLQDPIPNESGNAGTAQAFQALAEEDDPTPEDDLPSQQSADFDGPACGLPPRPIPKPSGAEARFREFMARRLGQSGVPAITPQASEPSLFSPPLTSVQFPRQSMAGLYDSSSSSSSSSASSVILEDPTSPPHVQRPISPASSSSSVFASLRGLDVGGAAAAPDPTTTINGASLAAALEARGRSSGGEGGEEKEVGEGEGEGVGEGEEEEEEWVVTRQDKLLDGFLTVQLRKIGRALNFMVRARASGIRVDSFDALAAVDPARWAQLAATPANAAEVAVDAMLGLSFWEVVILSKRASALLDELSTLGITI